VLVVDDDSTVRDTVGQQLRRLGFDVTLASGGTDALRLACEAESDFALAVVDQTMPGLSGEQLIAALRELEPNLPVVLMSGYRRKNLATPDDRLTFLQKPMTTEQLSEAVREVLSPRL
jgi:two-component system, cell cycle sensor histidine kinase and response regulator CckA